MRRLLPAALAALLIWPALGAGARTVGFQDWLAISADLEDRRLVWSESATVRLDPSDAGRDLPRGLRPFVYYRVHVASARLDRTRRGFAGQPDQLLALRTQIARMTSGHIAGTGSAGFVVMPHSSRFAVPVVWCCDDDIETVVYSDGRADAARHLAAAVDGEVVRAVVRDGDGAALLTGDPRERIPALARAAFPGTPSARRVAMARGLVAWVDDEDRRGLRFGVPTDAGVIAERSVALPGEALRVWADRGLVVVAVRQNDRIALVRIDVAGPRQRVVWRGTRLPRVGLGEGTVAVGDGRDILAGRGAPLRRVTRARGRVAAVAPSGRRVAWFERVRRKGERRTVARIGRLR
ncbi:MAG: hypothetical protein ACR2N6_03205 [Miltoncostaeaceae bacterium]